MDVPFGGTAIRVGKFVFKDLALAFGDRSLQAMEVAFVLWSKQIASQPQLFGKGIDWYDSSRSSAELLTLMSSQGGGIDGRAHVAGLLAVDAVNVASITATGFIADGLPCALNWGPQPLFALPG